MIIFDVNTTNMNVVVATTSGGYVQLSNSDSFHRSGYVLIGWTPATGSNLVYPMDHFFPVTNATPTIVMRAVSQFNHTSHHQLPG